MSLPNRALIGRGTTKLIPCVFSLALAAAALADARHVRPRSDCIFVAHTSVAAGAAAEGSRAQTDVSTTAILFHHAQRLVFVLVADCVAHFYFLPLLLFSLRPCPFFVFSVAQLLSAPFMRERIPHWLSHRRILVEFGGELSRLPDFELAPQLLTLPASRRSTSAQHKAARQKEPPPSASTAVPAASGSKPGRGPTERSSRPGPPSSLVIPPRSMLAASVSTTAAGAAAVYESATPSPMSQSHAHVQSQAQSGMTTPSRPRAASASSLLDRLTVLQTPRSQQLQAQRRQPLTPPSNFSIGARQPRPPYSACATPRAASSTASGGSGRGSESSAIGSVARVTTPSSASAVSASSGGHSRTHSSSTPSPLPVLRFYPLSLTPLPPQSRAAAVTPAAVMAADRAAVPSSSSSSSSSDSHERPAVPSSTSPSPAGTLVTVPSSVPSFAWRVPAAFAAALQGASGPSSTSSASAAAPSPASLSLQCERVRAWLEQQIQFGTLKRAYDLMREQTAEHPALGDGEAKGGELQTALASASSASRHAHDSRVLQVLQLSQTHLITLLQQLVQAERAQEEA